MVLEFLNPPLFRCGDDTEIEIDPARTKFFVAGSVTVDRAGWGLGQKQSTDCTDDA